MNVKDMIYYVGGKELKRKKQREETRKQRKEHFRGKCVNLIKRARAVAR